MAAVIAERTETTMTDEIKGTPPVPETNWRWQFVRDVLVFQGKLLMDGLRDLTLLPISIFAALIDVIKGGDRPGRHFYDVVHFGRQTEIWIHLFEAADRAPETERPRPQIDIPSVDEFVRRLEGMIKEEYDRGDISASAKRVVDETIHAAERVLKKEEKKNDPEKQQK